MLRIGLEIDRLCWQDRSGLTSHTVGILNGFKAAGMSHCITLFLNRRSAATIRPEHHDVVSDYRVKRFDNTYKHGYRLRMRLSAYGRQDVFQYLSSIYDPIQNYRLNSFLIPDLTPIRMPECHLPEHRDFWLKHFETIASNTGLVLTYSEHTRQEAIALLGLAPERVVAIPLGYGPEYHVLPRERVATALQPLGLEPGRYILNVGTQEPRKNHGVLFRAYAKLKDRGLVKGVPLVLSGGRGWLYEPMLEELSRLGLQEDVRYVGFVDCLPELYNGAIVMVYPSFYEGFGLPPLEAMACGTPTIVSNASSLPEVVGSTGVCIDPSDADGLAESIARVLTDSAYRQSMSASGLMRASQFSWAICAKNMYAAYELAYRRFKENCDRLVTATNLV